MLGDVSGLEKIYIVCGYTDMRKSLPFLWKKTGQDQSLVPRTGWLRSDL